MRGVFSVRANEEFAAVFSQIDSLLDNVPMVAPTSSFQKPTFCIISELSDSKKPPVGRVLFAKHTTLENHSPSNGHASNAGATGKIALIL